MSGPMRLGAVEEIALQRASARSSGSDARALALHAAVIHTPVLHRGCRRAQQAGEEETMRKSIGGIVGLAVGGVLGNALGGPVMVVLTSGLGGLLGYFLGRILTPVGANRRS
jgi:hypothetical protein